MNPPSEPVVFDPESHAVDAFRCGREGLDGRLRSYAGSGLSRDPARTFVTASSDGTVLGYYTVVVSEIATAQAAAPITADASQREPISVAMIARLAVDEGHQGGGVGRGLLLDALRRIVRASEEVAVRAVIAPAADRKAQGFYRHFGFEPSGLEPDLLMVPVRSVRRVVGGDASDLRE